MKQLLVLLFLVSSMACFGQNKDALKDISSVTFYGIDFTRAKVYGAKEGPMQFKYTFDDINKRINVRAEIVPVKLCAVVIVLTVIDHIRFAECLCVYTVPSGLDLLKLSIFSLCD